MQSVTPKWTQQRGAVLVCEKCYKSRIPEEAPEVAARIGDFNLRDWLKRACKKAGYGKSMRVINSGCLDVCGRDTVTVTLLPRADVEHSQTLVVDPIDDRDALYQRIVEVMGPPESENEPE